MKLKYLVEETLKNIPETRNCDITLMIEIWKRFYSDRMKKSSINGKIGIYLEDLYDLPREDNIKRLRAKFQNELKQYLPTKWEVAKGRGFKELEWRQYLGYNN